MRSLDKKISSIYENIILKYEFRKWHNFIDKSQWWTGEQHSEYQWSNIKQLLNYGYKYIPYYGEVFKELHATPDDFKSYSDFSKFPFLTKDIIRERLEDLVPLDYDRKKLILYNTGGSTGIPLSFYKTKRDDIIEKAFMVSQWERVGYKRDHSRVIIRGEVLKEGKLWEKSNRSNVWWFSAYQLSERNVKLMLDKLNEIKPKFLHVYPTSLQILTQLLIDQNLKPGFSPIAILSGSEILSDQQRKLFELYFGCRVFSWLGLAEQTILAGECEHSEKLHIFSEHSYVELVDSDNKVITEKGIQGEIIGTRLNRYIIPFIRYRSGDLSSYSSQSCVCNRNYKLLDKVVGRVQDVVLTSENKKFLLLHFFLDNI